MTATPRRYGSKVTRLTTLKDQLDVRKCSFTASAAAWKTARHALADDGNVAMRRHLLNANFAFTDHD
ncbi:hypothetical protein AUP68_04143 [Ilyonectria robusta]